MVFFGVPAYDSSKSTCDQRPLIIKRFRVLSQFMKPCLKVFILCPASTVLDNNFQQSSTGEEQMIHYCVSVSDFTGTISIIGPSYFIGKLTFDNLDFLVRELFGIFDYSLNEIFLMVVLYLHRRI